MITRSRWSVAADLIIHRILQYVVAVTAIGLLLAFVITLYALASLGGYLHHPFMAGVGLLLAAWVDVRIEGHIVETYWRSLKE